jgi:hypothetical protein
LHLAAKNIATNIGRSQIRGVQALSAFIPNSYRRATALVTGILLLRAPIAVGLDVRSAFVAERFPVGLSVRDDFSARSNFILHSREIVRLTIHG